MLIIIDPSVYPKFLSLISHLYFSFPTFHFQPMAFIDESRSIDNRVARFAFLLMLAVVISLITGLWHDLAFFFSS